MALDIIAELEAIIDALDAAGVDYAVCGGLAMGILAVPRMTKDIDLLVRESDVVRAKAVVKSVGFDIPAKPMTFELVDVGRISGRAEDARVSKLDPATSNLLSLDFLVVEPVFHEVWDTRIVVGYLNRKVKVVSVDGLVTMKTRAGRPTDLRDIEQLKFSDDDET
jgi:hypothetical protein